MVPLHSSQNWLLITFDQWRGDWLHQPWLRLPALRKMAAEGWDLRRCYTSSPQCVPARVSWLTGLSPKSLQLTINKPYTVANDAPSFVRDLKNNFNYYTSLVGKTHWTPHETECDLRDNLPLMRDLGFDHVTEISGPRALTRTSCMLTDLWREEGLLDAYKEDLQKRYENGCAHVVKPTILPEHLYPDIWLTGIALEQLHNMPTNRPWLLWVSFPGPHEPFDVPLSWSRTRNIPPAESRPQDSELLRKIAPIGSVLESKIKRWPEGIPEDALELLRQDYANHLELLDCQVSILLDALKNRSDSGNTAVTCCSDHGELLGDWGLLLKGCFLEGAIRSIFIHRPPKARNLLRRFLKHEKYAYGLTESLWAAANSVSSPSDGSFGMRVRQLPKQAEIAFADEEIVVT